MILPFLFIAPTLSMGRGVFTSENIAAGTIVEVAPVIIMSMDERILLDQTLLHNYIFEWENDQLCCMALGYVPVYNHSYKSNCEYEMNFEEKLINVKSIRSINAGDELFINYNGDWNEGKPLWFDAK